MSSTIFNVFVWLVRVVVHVVLALYSYMHNKA